MELLLVLKQLSCSGLVNFILGSSPRLVTENLRSGCLLCRRTIGAGDNRRFSLFLFLFLLLVVEEEKCILGRLGSLRQQRRFFLSDKNSIC